MYKSIRVEDVLGKSNFNKDYLDRTSLILSSKLSPTETTYSPETEDTGWKEINRRIAESIQVFSNQPEHTSIEVSNPDLPRSYRNNNPGNIRHNKDTYVGEVTSQDKSFKAFKDMAHGFRAMFKTYQTYIKNGYNTMQAIVSRWAPTNENNTAGYILRVTELSGINPNDIIDPTNQEQMSKLAYAMATVEGGKSPETLDIASGWSLLQNS